MRQWLTNHATSFGRVAFIRLTSNVIDWHDDDDDGDDDGDSGVAAALCDIVADAEVQASLPATEPLPVRIVGGRTDQIPAWRLAALPAAREPRLPRRAPV